MRTFVSHASIHPTKYRSVTSYGIRIKKDYSKGAAKRTMKVPYAVLRAMSEQLLWVGRAKPRFNIGRWSAVSGLPPGIVDIFGPPPEPSLF